MEKINAVITGVGGYVPDYVLTNEELSRMVDTNDEWIMTRIGVKERRILNEEGLGTSYMARKAAKQLMQKTNSDPDSIPDQLKEYLPLFSLCADEGKYIQCKSGTSVIVIDSQPYIIGPSDEKGWVNISTTGRKQYGLNIKEHRFSYGVWPAHWEDVIKEAYRINGKKMNPEFFIQANTRTSKKRGYTQKYQIDKINFKKVWMDNIEQAIEYKLPYWFEPYPTSHGYKLENFIDIVLEKNTPKQITLYQSPENMGSPTRFWEMPVVYMLSIPLAQPEQDAIIMVAMAATRS